MPLLDRVRNREANEVVEDAKTLMELLQSSCIDESETAEELRVAVEEMYKGFESNGLPLKLLIPSIRPENEETSFITDEEIKNFINKEIERKAVQHALSELRNFFETPHRCFDREWDIEKIAGKVEGLGSDDEKAWVQQSASRAHVAMAKIHYDHLLKESGAKPVYHHYIKIQKHLESAHQDFKAITDSTDDRSPEALQKEIEKWTKDRTLDYAKEQFRRFQQFRLPQSPATEPGKRSKIKFVDPSEIYDCLNEMGEDVSSLDDNAKEVIQDGCRRQMQLILQEVRLSHGNDLKELYASTMRYAGLLWDQCLEAEFELAKAIDSSSHSTMRQIGAREGEFWEETVSRQRRFVGAAR